jgi:hypothetical protein
MAWKAKYPFSKMKAGESVFIDGASGNGPEAAAARKHFKRCGAKYSVRCRDGGIVVSMLSDAAVREKAQRKRKPQMFSGNRPNGEQWSLAGECRSDNADWEVWVTPPNDAGWAGVKVCAKDMAIRKANYWLNWNGERLAKGVGLNLMLTGRAPLVDKVVEILKGVYDDD